MCGLRRRCDKLVMCTNSAPLCQAERAVAVGGNCWKRLMRARTSLPPSLPGPPSLHLSPCYLTGHFSQQVLAFFVELLRNHMRHALVGMLERCCHVLLQSAFQTCQLWALALLRRSRPALFIMPVRRR